MQASMTKHSSSTATVSAGGEGFRSTTGPLAMAASGGYGKTLICAGIVSHVNLLLGDDAKGVLEAEME